MSTNADSGAGSLREAITCANSGERITFDAALAGQTITLASSTLEIPIGKNLIIDASNTPNLTLSGNNSVRILILNSTSVNSTSLTVKNLRFINGRTVEYGGAIRTTHQGILTVENCFFSNNRAAIMLIMYRSYTPYGGQDISFSAVLIILFFLIRLWRKEYRESQNKL